MAFLQIHIHLIIVLKEVIKALISAALYRVISGNNY